VFNNLSFGDISNQNAIKKSFGSTSDYTSFDVMHMVEDELYNSDATGKDFFYFLKLVPNIFID